ncbi:Bug family tripartite tricarboxylate transporter substrate binding protein [Variovorax sp. HJSM1_2]|uniref:Bug family tripartite tricarboxylate transporter substrate binding protein n=1 Tax=Variovorax sp. HJSM1_2 TaxID=3366263 RepID=UPI003BD1F64F
MKTNFWKAIAATLLALGATLAQAQAYPNQPVRWIVPYPAGGGTDIVARMLGQSMGGAMGQQMLIDNKPGAGTMIGGDLVARAKADGYTVGTVDTSTVALAPHLYAKVPYKPEKDFVYVGGTTRFPFVLVVNPSVPANSLQELIALAKQKPGGLKYATPGLGGPNHLGMELFQRKAGVQLLHVPYKGDAPALLGLMGGEVDMYLVNTAASLSYIRSGKVRPIALSMGKRSPVLPDVPTFAEAGVPDFESYSWQGMAVAAGTPPVVVARLNTELNKALASDEVQKKLSDLGIEPSPTTPDEFMAFVKAQNTLWGGVIRQANIKLEE